MEERIEEEEEPKREVTEFPVAGLIAGPAGTAGLPSANVPAAASLAATSLSEALEEEEEPEVEDEEPEAHIDYEGLSKFAHDSKSKD